MIVNVTNTADIKVLKDRVATLDKALGLSRENVRITEQQRDNEALEAVTYANLARTLAAKLGISRETLLEMRAECRKVCEADQKKRGVKAFAAEPPKFILK